MRDDLIGLFADFLIFLVIAILLPQIWCTWQCERMIYCRVCEETDRFARSISLNGYVDIDMYDHFIKTISESGHVYDVSFDCSVREYDADTGNEYTEVYPSYMVYNALTDKGAFILDIGATVTVSLIEKAGTHPLRFIIGTINGFDSYSRPVAVTHTDVEYIQQFWSDHAEQQDQ